MTVSPLNSTLRRARSMTISATETWLRAISSAEEAMTSPCTERRKSVTSSGRSSTSSTTRSISGWLVEMALAICFSNVVLPVLGGATMRPRWPLPMGVTRSSTRMDSSSRVVSSLMRSSGSREITRENGNRSRASSRVCPLTELISTRDMTPLPWRECCAMPSMRSPSWSSNCLIRLVLTCTSFWSGR